MASKPRDYVQNVAVGISARCILRLDLYSFEEAKQRLKQLFRHYEKMCEVEIIDFVIRDNHWHVIIVQRNFSGHDKQRKKGIAAWVRNVRMMSTRTLNAVYSTQGCLSERVYRSVNLKTNERLLAHQAYVQANGLHHANEAPDQSAHTSWILYGKGEATGVVTQVPDYCADGSLGDNRKFLCALQRLAMRYEREGRELPWLRAAQELIAAQAPSVLPEAQPSFVPVTELIDEADHKAACQALDDWEFPRVEFEPRRAPSVGKLIEIRIRRELDPVLLFPE